MKAIIKDQVEQILGMYGKVYDDDGVMANLRAWERNKRELIGILRKHPNWSEDALAIIFEVEDIREINKADVDYCRTVLSALAYAVEISDDDRRAFQAALQTACNAYAKTITNEYSAKEVKDLTGVNCAVGQKTSRVINALCRKYGIDKHADYNTRFAALADTLNPLTVKKKALLSVHPGDYLQMSNRNNSWSSCHCLEDGGWQAGTLSYMNDSVSMIFYTVDDKITTEYHNAPKRSRQVFAYANGMLLQSRLYPKTHDENLRENYRNIVQKALAECLGVPNLWTLKKEHDDVQKRVETDDDAMHYADYTYSNYKANVSLLKAVQIDEDDKIHIGHTAYCVCCGEALCENNNVNCCDCEDDGQDTCYHCGYRYNTNDMHDIGGEWYCDDCCGLCECCDEYVVGSLTDARNSRGHWIRVCQDCLESLFYYCESCDTYHHENHGDWIDGTFYCDDCTDEYFYTCESCGDYVRVEDAIEHDGCWYCECCAEDLENDEDLEDGMKESA